MPSIAPLVAVIVVNYRTPDLTIAAVESALASRGVSPMIVVVDNASGDDSASRLTAHFHAEPAVTIAARTVNDGFTGGNNAGAAIARARGAAYLFLLNSDATVAPGALSALVAEAERDLRFALVTPRIFFTDPPDRLWFGGGDFSFWRGRAVHLGFRRSASRGRTEPCDVRFASGCALLVRLSALGDADLFDATLFAYAEDLDLSLRVRGAGHAIRYLPAATVHHADGASHRRAGGNALRFYLSTRNSLRVLARHARWYHWPVLGPVVAVDLIGRYLFATLRRGDVAAARAVVRGVMHACFGLRSAFERNAAAAQDTGAAPRAATSMNSASY